MSVSRTTVVPSGTWRTASTERERYDDDDPVASSDEASALLNRFAEYDDRWWMGFLRDAADRNPATSGCSSSAGAPTAPAAFGSGRWISRTT